MYIFISWRLWHCSWFPCTSLWLFSRVLLPCAQWLGGSRVLSLVLFLSHSAHSPRGARSIPVASRPSAWWWLQSWIPVQTFLALPDTWVCCDGWSTCISGSALAKPILGCPLLPHPVPIHPVTWDMKATLCLHAFLVCISFHEIGGKEETCGVDLHRLSVHLTSMCSCYSAFIWILLPRSLSVAVTSGLFFCPSPAFHSILLPLGYLPLPGPHYPLLRLCWGVCFALNAVRAPGRINFLPEWPYSARVVSSNVISGSLLCLFSVSRLRHQKHILRAGTASHHLCISSTLHSAWKRACSQKVRVECMDGEVRLCWIQ